MRRGFAGKNEALLSSPLNGGARCLGQSLLIRCPFPCYALRLQTPDQAPCALEQIVHRLWVNMTPRFRLSNIALPERGSLRSTACPEQENRKLRTKSIGQNADSCMRLKSDST